MSYGAASSKPIVRLVYYTEGSSKVKSRGRLAVLLPSKYENW